MEMKTYTLKLTAAIAIAGALRTPNDKQGGLVDVSEGLAKNLLHRGKARLATAEDLAAAGREVPAADEDTDTGPTRADLDTALADEEFVTQYAGKADYVVPQMRGHFGALFTDADEARVRELLKVPAKPSDGLKVAELRAALEAKGVAIPADCNTKAELAALLDAQPAA
jgi:hypothetical protein